MATALPIPPLRPSPAGAVCSPSRRRRSSKRELRAFAERHSFWVCDWERYAGAEALADQVRFDARVGGPAQVRVAQGDRRDRRPADLRRCGRGGPCWRTRGSSASTWRRACPRTTSARPGSSGGTRSTTGGRCRRERLPLVDGTLPPQPRALRPRARRPLPGLRLLLGRPCGRTRRTRRTLAARTRGGALPGGAGGARLAVADRRGPRRHHSAGRAPAGRARAARHGRPAVRLRRRPAQPTPARELPREPRRLHRHARHEHGASAGGAASTRSAGQRPGSTRASRTGRWSSSRCARARGSRSCRCRTCSDSAARHA